MGYTSESAKLSDIEKIMQQWPAYAVIGNKSYAKGCFLIKKAYRDGERVYHLPKVLVAMDKNWDMLQLIQCSKFHPERALSLVIKTQPRGLLEGLISMEETSTDLLHNKSWLLKKSMELLHEGAELAGLFLTDESRDDINIAVNGAVGELKIVHKFIRLGVYPTKKDT